MHIERSLTISNTRNNERQAYTHEYIEEVRRVVIAEVARQVSLPYNGYIQFGSCPPSRPSRTVHRKLESPLRSQHCTYTLQYGKTRAPY